MFHYVNQFALCYQRDTENGMRKIAGEFPRNPPRFTGVQSVEIEPREHATNSPSDARLALSVECCQWSVMPSERIPDAAERDPEARKVITRKRKKFARLMATGQYTQQAAYEAAYNVKSGSANAHRQNGHQVSKLPEVQQLIREFEEEILPLGDLRQEQEQVLAHLKALAFNALDEKTRVTASVHLYHLLEAHRQTEERIKARRPVSAVIPVDAVVSELLQIAESQPAIELETLESEDAGSEAIEPTETE